MKRGTSNSTSQWNRWIRQSHRWVSMAFTLCAAANVVVMAVNKGAAPAWVTYSPLPPLMVLLVSGFYLFMLPHAARWGAGQRAPELIS